MRKRNRTGVVAAVISAVALTSLILAGSASAKLTGEFARFAQCPYTNPEVHRCLHAVTTGGTVKLGSKTVTITSPATVQGGYQEVEEGEFSKFFAAKNGQTLTKAPQKVPGGLAGLVNCPEISNFILRAACEWTFENGLTGVNSTLELAGTSNDIEINELNLALGEGVTLKMKLKVRLENPLLGSNCYVGSSSKPILWELRPDTTNPPPPNTPITGNPGTITFLEKARVLRLDGVELVDNAWAAPATSGCGGLFSFILDPIVSAASGLPSAAGNNSAILKNTVHTTTSFALKQNDAENP
jgi:hypothetical protein